MQKHDDTWSMQKATCDVRFIFFLSELFRNLCAFGHARKRCGRISQKRAWKVIDTRQHSRWDEIPDLENFVEWQKTNSPAFSSFWCPLLACKPLSHNKLFYLKWQSHAVELDLQQEPRVTTAMKKTKFSLHWLVANLKKAYEQCVG